MWGGVPRTALQFIHNKAWGNRILSKVNTDMIEKCMRYDGEISYTDVDDVTGALLHLIPVDDEYITTQVLWASRKLCNIAINTLLLLDKERVVKHILSTKGIGTYGGLRGYMFENLAHEIICAGGTFKVRTRLVVRLPLPIALQVRDLDNNGPEATVTFPQLKLYQFKKISDLKGGNYNTPESKTFQSVDALVPPNTLYQMTVSPSHGIKV